jgi:hypothetical protein
MTNQQTIQPKQPVRREDSKVQKLMQDIERRMAQKASEPAKKTSGGLAASGATIEYIDTFQRTLPLFRP